MPPKYCCTVCRERRAALKRPRNGDLLCQECFFASFEQEVHETIVRESLFKEGDVVACGASGGKDSTVLIHLMKTLNERHRYGVRLLLVSIDEGIVGYRDDSLETVKRNSACYDLPLRVLSYRELFGWTMDEVVSVVGLRNNCTYCGVFRRQALERGAALVGANKIVTGHNADDTAETVLMNLLRADAPRLARCTAAITDTSDGETLPRVKPLKYAFEKEIVLYAHFKKLDYFTTECTYAKEAFRGHVRALIKEVEAIRPRAILDTIYTGERLVVAGHEPRDAAEADSSASPASQQELRNCARCGFVTSQRMCRSCVLLHTLEKSKPTTPAS